jgi:lysophospholipase L1-like esterase
MKTFLPFSLLMLLLGSCSPKEETSIKDVTDEVTPIIEVAEVIEPLVAQALGDKVVLVGNGLGSRMMQHGFFEAEVYLRNADKNLTIRNLCDECNTPGFWPHAARVNPWTFSGAEKFTERFDTRETHGTTQMGRGFEKSPDEWLKQVQADTIMAFFGFNESFKGPAGLDNFKQELSGYLKHLQSSVYNKKAPQIILISPIAFQDLSATHNTPNGISENKNLSLYTEAMRVLANKHEVAFVDIFTPTQKWFNSSKDVLTVDGASLNAKGYEKLSKLLANKVYGSVKAENNILSKVKDKNWYWHNYYKIPNGVHVYGVRHKPYGPENYPAELKKLAQMVSNRDRAIWAALAHE